MGVKMDQEHYDRLDEDYMYLSVSLRQNIRRLVKYLFEKEIITEDQREDIMDEASDTLKSQTLIDYIMEGDETVFKAFYEGSINTQLWRAADILMPENGPHKPDEEDIDEMLPEIWPNESHFEDIRNPQKINVKKVGSKQPKMSQLFVDCSQESETLYKMSNKIKGRVLIINNEDFEGRFPPRSGSSYDKQGLEHIFSQLGFEIIPAENKTEREMKQLMIKEAKNDHSEYNCFFLFILSYGSMSSVFGIDTPTATGSQKGVTMEWIKELFSNVPSLVNKPKVFLLESEEPSSFPDNEGPVLDMHGMGLLNRIKDPMPPDYSRPTKTQSPLEEDMNMEADSCDLDFDGRTIQSDDGDIASKASSSAPSRSDIFEYTAHPGGRIPDANKGHPFGSRERYGSWFIQALIYAITHYAHQNDLASLLVKVNAARETSQLSAPSD